MPLLLGFATLLFAYSERISRWLRKRAEGRGHAIDVQRVEPESAAAGVVLRRLFRRRRRHPDPRRVLVATGGDYRSANVAKNFVSSLNGLAATLSSSTQGAVLWPQTLALMAGTIGGGLAGAYVARVIPRNVVRVLVVVVGAALTIAFAAPLLVRRLKRQTVAALRQCSTTRAVIALSGSASGSTTVKWLAPAISS